MQWFIALMGFVGGLGAAGMTAFISMRESRSRMAADIRGRWDAALLAHSDELTAAVRSVRHHAERYPRSIDKDRTLRMIDEEHNRARVLGEQLRLVGNIRVQIAARAVIHHLYAVRVNGEEGRDPRADKFPDSPPLNRLNDALQEFYRAVRVQLNAMDAEEVLHDADLNKIMGHDGLDASARSTMSP